MISFTFAAPDIGNVIVRFCNDGDVLKHTEFETVPGETVDVCLRLGNDSTEDVTVDVGFVDGTITNDASQYKACKTSDQKNNFGKFVEMEETVFTIPARTALEKRFTVTYPDGFAGMSYGCVVTKVVAEEEKTGGGMLAIEVRRGNFIDIFVDGEIFL